MIRDVVVSLDPGIRILRSLRTGRGRYVYKVEKHDSVYVMKVSPVSGYFGELLKNEKMCIEMLDGVRGVPQIMEVYSTPSHIAIRRDYIEGTLLANAGKVVPKTFWDELKCLVDRVHARGVSGLDIKTDNILLCRSPTAALFDFDMAVTDDSESRTYDRKDVKELRVRYLRTVN